MIEELAALVGAIDAAAKNAEALPALFSALLRLPGPLFADALLLKSGGGGAFVVIHAPELSAASRSWMRWPLRRLFARMKPSRITNPCLPTQHALAIPFSYDAARYVVLALLTETACDRRYEHFFEILERMTVPVAHRDGSGGEIPATPMEPVIAGLGLWGDLYDRVDRTLRRRGWALVPMRGFAELWDHLLNAVPDVIAVDLDTLEEPLSALLSIHRAADSVPLRILAFGDKPCDEYGAAAVIDCMLPRDADEQTLFKAFKELACDASLLRNAHARGAEAATLREARVSVTSGDLARVGAERAAAIMHGWACCVLFSDAGTVYRAEHPHAQEPVFPTVPKSFLSEAFYDLRVGDDFLNEVTDHASERMALLALKPLSGATLPIVSDSGKRYGVLVACSCNRWADSAAFAALERLARTIGERHEALRPARVTIPEFRRDRCWERLRDRSFGIDVYRSSDYRVPWRYCALSDTTALLTLGFDDDGTLRRTLSQRGPIESGEMMRHVASLGGDAPSFAATIDFTRESMTYAANGFTPPISLIARGPMASLRNADGITAGTASLPSSAEAAILDTGLWRWLNGRAAVDRLRPLLELEAPTGVASFVRLG